MTLTIFVPDESVIAPAMMELYGAFGGKNKPVPGGVEYPFSLGGELKFTAKMYADCKLNGCTFNGGMFYTVQPQSILTENVPDTMPDYSYTTIDEDDNVITIARKWGEYSFQNILLDDGTVLMMCRHKKYLETCGCGCPDDERKIWDDHFGGLLVKSEGDALKPVVDTP